MMIETLEKAEDLAMESGSVEQAILYKWMRLQAYQKEWEV